MALRAADLLATVKEHPDGAVVRVRVVPRANRTRIVGVHGDALRTEVGAAPVEGAANEELRRFLARACGVPRGDVEILTGESARSKAVLIRGRHPLQVAASLSRDW